jgi:hypothetical protein
VGPVGIAETITAHIVIRVILLLRFQARQIAMGWQHIQHNAVGVLIMFHIAIDMDNDDIVKIITDIAVKVSDIERRIARKRLFYKIMNRFLQILVPIIIISICILVYLFYGR